MLVVGLTGGIASGKSAVSSLLTSSSSSNNIPVIDSDDLARQVVQPGTRALKSIVSVFGPSVLHQDGTLDRKKLGSIIFNDEEKRKRLNAIVHPAVRRAMVWQALGYWFRGYKCCVLAIPLLIEGGFWNWVGLVVVVSCPEDTQLERLMQRDGSSKEDALSRINSQMPMSSKVSYADVVIDNSGTRSELEAHVQALVRELDASAGWTWRISWLLPPLGLLSALGHVLWRRFTKKRKRD